MPTTEWLNKYESIKDKLVCKTDLDAHFTEQVIGNMGVNVLDSGAVHFPTGTIFACDPLVELNIINLRKKWKGICSQVPFIVLKYRQGCI